MSIFYLDPINGLDTNTGADWTNSWKTFAAGPTAARIAPGDTIRIAKTPDPTDVGTATWTSRKRGNSITFDTAPTKQIDTMKSGWVTLGAGSTVTNNQANAYMMYGATLGTGSALQVTTSAGANLAYKSLGSTQDFSSNQQISFWFRSNAAFNCTGAQNMTIQLCSDTAGTVVVDTLTLPKWSYSLNLWYPVVIDKGSALGSNIQSVSIVTTSATTQTFYFDEMFASPAGGLTLQSLIEDNESAWYAIRTIRGADVWLMSNYGPSSAAAGSFGAASHLDTGWAGVTANFMTRKRETLKIYGSTGPSVTTWCQTNEAGTWGAGTKLINTYSFGWDTATDTQNGYTFADNLIAQGTFISTSTLAWRIENCVSVRFSSGIISTSNAFEFNKIGAIANTSSISISNFTSSSTYPSYNRIFEILSVTGNQNGPSIISSSTNFTPAGFNITYGKIFGNGSGITIQGFTHSKINFSTIIIGGASSSSPGVIISVTASNIYKIARMEGAVSQLYPTGFTYNNTFQETNGSIFLTYAYQGPSFTTTNSTNCIIDIDTLDGSGTIIGAQNTPGANNVVRCRVNNSSQIGVLKYVYPPFYTNNPAFIQDYNGVGGAAVVVGAGPATGSGFYGTFELQTADVHTAGSKAWLYTVTGAISTYYNSVHTIKLASAAVVADKLVTVSCYVKKSNENQDVGIKVPAIFLPGYTEEISSSFTGTVGAWQQLTITFTPTANCVFDLLGFINYTSTVAATTVVWDDLSITQEA